MSSFQHLGPTPYTYNNGSSLAPPLIVHHHQGCIDLKGQSIPHGLLFAPGPDECQICSCSNGQAETCRTLLCSPPPNCRSLRVGKQCCEWICLDPGHGQADVKLRLVAAAVTTILSVALLFFMIYRLRKRRLASRRRRRERDGRRRAEDDISMDSMAATDRGGHSGHGGGYQVAVLAPQQQQRQSYWYSSWAWWKPSTNDMFETRPAPPSYDFAMMHSMPGGGGPEVQQGNYDQQQIRGPGDHSDDCSSMESNGSEAPPYSEIHLDPVIVEPTEWFRQQAAVAAQQQQLQIQQQQPPQYPSRLATLPCGAALVLPPVPAAAILNHVTTPSERQQQEQQERRLQQERSEGHVQTAVSLVNENRPPETTALATMRAARTSRRRAEQRDGEQQASAAAAPPQTSQRPAGNATLPHVIRRLRARSREGIVLPPEERDAVLQRFSLQLNLNLSSSDGSSSSSTINTMSPDRRAANRGGRPRSVEPPLNRARPQEPALPISSASSEEEY